MDDSGHFSVPDSEGYFQETTGVGIRYFTKLNYKSIPRIVYKYEEMTDLYTVKIYLLMMETEVLWALINKIII